VGFQDQQQMGRDGGNDNIRRSRFFRESNRHQARKIGCRRIFGNFHMDTRVRIRIHSAIDSGQLDSATVN